MSLFSTVNAPVEVQTRTSERVVLTLSCPDARGIVHAVSGVLLDLDYNIIESQEFHARRDGMFFMRVEAEQPDGTAADVDALHAAVEQIAPDFGLRWRVVPASHRTRVVILVSKYGHCLNDLLFRSSTGALDVEVAMVVSNHPDLGRLADNYEIPFRHVPVTPDTKPEAEAELLALVHDAQAELVVLARYMQILSDELCQALQGRAINIHHSMLPSFKGARPYHQAYERGVKLVGATAHYVTADLDEGPIIDQEVARVDHTMTEAEFTARGRDTEALVLSRAVRWHCENRVMLHNNRTVVFR
ncbi:MAG: formyltetrahydrofolate deformylase [Solirubrobacteraceae bacterium]